MLDNGRVRMIRIAEAALRGQLRAMGNPQTIACVLALSACAGEEAEPAPQLPVKPVLLNEQSPKQCAPLNGVYSYKAVRVSGKCLPESDESLVQFGDETPQAGGGPSTCVTTNSNVATNNCTANVTTLCKRDDGGFEEYVMIVKRTEDASYSEAEQSLTITQKNGSTVCNATYMITWTKKNLRRQHHVDPTDNPFHLRSLPPERQHLKHLLGPRQPRSATQPVPAASNDRCGPSRDLGDPEVAGGKRCQPLLG